MAEHSTDRLILQYPGFWDAAAGEMVFLIPRSQVCVSDPVALAVLPLCDGSRDAEQIVSAAARVLADASTDQESCTADIAYVLDELCLAALVGPVNNLGLSALGWGDNPQVLVPARPAEVVAAQHLDRARRLRPSETSMRTGRVTHRRFACTSPGDPCPEVQLARAATSSVLPTVAHRPVPSPGGLYSVSMTLLCRSGGLFSLVHDNDISSAGQDTGVGLTDPAGAAHSSMLVDADQVRAAFDDESLLGSACAVAVIGVDFGPTAFKYGPRGARLALLEAGGYMQALIDRADQVGLGCYPYAGFRDLELQHLLGWEGVMPVLCVGLGRPSPVPSPGPDLLDQLASSQAAFVTSVGLRVPTDADEIPGSLVVVEFTSEGSAGDPAESFGAGFGSTTRSSELRARAEAEERRCSGLARSDLVSSAAELDLPWVSAGDLTGVDPAPGCPWLVPHTEDLVIDWVIARRAVSKHQVLVPADACFYPRSSAQLGRPLVAAANSSGVAAGTVVRPALDSACLELLERAAFVQAWFGVHDFEIITGMTDHGWRARLARAIGSYGFQLVLFRLPSVVPVVMAAAFRSSYPSVLVGAGADWTDPHRAGTKALEELAGSVRAFGDTAPVPPPDQSSLRGPRDHLFFHADPARSGMLLAMLEDSSPVLDARTFDWGPGSTPDEFITAHDPLVVDYTRPGSPLEVLRVFIPTLPGIWFGSGVVPRPLTGARTRPWSALPHWFP